MKLAALGLAVLLLSVAASPQDRQLVLLAAHRAGRIEVFDPASLARIGSIKVLPLADGVSSSPDGEILYVLEGLAPDFRGCCALYALNLETKRMTQMIAPSDDATISPDGDYVLTQRGAVGIEVYDGRTFERERPVPRSLAPGVYSLSFSPDGQLLFGATNWPQPSLDIFDFASRQLARRYPISGSVALVGSWVRNDFYLYAHDGVQGQLWRVSPQDKALGVPLKIKLPDVAPECAIYNERMAGSGSRVLLYEFFGGKLDARSRLKCHTVRGGFFSVDPETGNIGRRLAGRVHFASLVPNPSGEDLYGIDLRNLGWESVRLVRINVRTGRVLAKRKLIPDIWFLDLAQIPRALVPHGQLETIHD